MYYYILIFIFPLDPTGALVRAPGPHAARLSGAPSHPLPTGTLKQSYPTGHTFLVYLTICHYGFYPKCMIRHYVIHPTTCYVAICMLILSEQAEQYR